MRFIIFVIDGPNNPASADEMQKIGAFNEKLHNNGHWITAAGIQPGSTATLIDNRNNKGEVKPGSLFDAPEYFSGFWIIEADNAETAHELAMEGSLCCNRRVELRPYIR